MSRIFYRKKFSDYLGEQRAIDDIYTFYVPDPIPPTPSPTPIPPTPTSTPTTTPTSTPTPTPSPQVFYSGLFFTGNTNVDACNQINPSVTLYSTSPFYTYYQQVFTQPINNSSYWIPFGLFLASGSTSYEYQYIGFAPGLVDLGACPSPTPTNTPTPTITPSSTPITPTPTPSNTPVTPTPTPSITPTNTPVTPTPTTTPTPTPTEPAGYKLQAENADFLQAENGDNINIEH